MSIVNLEQRNINDFISKTPKSKEAYEKAREYMAGGETRSVSYFEPYPLSFKEGNGFEIIDLDGNRYIDYISNYTSLIHGHKNPKIVKAIEDALSKVTAAPAGIEEQAILAKMICDRVPSVEKVRFCNSGTEATMFAVRAARAYTGKDGVIKMLGAYHGTTDLMEFSISPPVETVGNSLLPVPESSGIPANAGKDLFIAPFNDLKAVEDILVDHKDEIACIITEPFLGAGGVITCKPGYLQGLRDLADKYGVLFIIDEVQALRLSIGGAQKKYGVEADLSAFGKVIGGGLPVGAFGGRAEIMSVFDPQKEGHLSQSGTFNGNRITMAAGIASLELLDEECINRINSLGERLENGLKAVIDKHDVPMSTTRDGSLVNIHFMKEAPYDYLSSTEEDTALFKAWYFEMLKGGIFCAPRGLFVISSVMTEKEIDKAIKAFDSSISALKPYF